MTNHVVEVALIKYLISNIPNYTIQIYCMAYTHDCINNFNFIDNMISTGYCKELTLVCEAAAVI